MMGVVKGVASLRADSMDNQRESHQTPSDPPNAYYPTFLGPFYGTNRIALLNHYDHVGENTNIFIRLLNMKLH